MATKVGRSGGVQGGAGTAGSNGGGGTTTSGVSGPGASTAGFSSSRQTAGGNFGTSSPDQQVSASASAIGMDAARMNAMGSGAQAQTAQLQNQMAGQAGVRQGQQAGADFSRQRQMEIIGNNSSKMSQIRGQNAAISQSRMDFANQETSNRRSFDRDSQMMQLTQFGSERAAADSDNRQRLGNSAAAFQDRKHATQLATLQGNIQKDLADRQGQLEMAKIASQERLGALQAQTSLQQSMFGAISGSVGGAGLNYRYW